MYTRLPVPQSAPNTLYYPLKGGGGITPAQCCSLLPASNRYLIKLIHFFFIRINFKTISDRDLLPFAKNIVSFWLFLT